MRVLGELSPCSSSPKTHTHTKLPSFPRMGAGGCLKTVINNEAARQVLCLNEFGLLRQLPAGRAGVFGDRYSVISIR